jgi:hypothetical protein
MTAVYHGFSSRLTLPMSWDRLDGPPSEESRESTTWSNAAVLRYLLHEIDAQAAMRPADERLAEALAPVRAKLDLLIEMVGRLSYRQLTMPAMREVELTTTRIAWQSAQAIAVGTWLRLRLYFHTTFLEPLTLYSEVVRCDEDGPDDFHIQADLAEMPEAAGEAFTRLVFFAQRRRLAEHSAASAAR